MTKIRACLRANMAASVMLPALATLGCSGSDGPDTPSGAFHLEEATIGDIHAAIAHKHLTCTQLVQAYIARSAAYNGPCTRLVTEDGAPVEQATGYTRAGALFSFPTDTVAVNEMLPDLDKYEGLPLDLGRMESSVSNPDVSQQMGVITGIPHAGQVNALETLNIRGERSVTCRGDFDKAPSAGALPDDAPAECEAFRQQPDALERAAALDAKYGNAPDLDAMPMYCVAFSIKDWYDAKDMRSAGGNDVAFAMDAPPTDSTLVARLRDKGAIILGKSIASQVTNSSDSGPKSPEKLFFPSTDNARATWGGATCTPYNTQRSPGFSSVGAGASVAANLVTCGICETTGGSCRI
ncbi:MAG TPA: amidase family protein, partial [Polyangiaceae bacterium]